MIKIVSNKYTWFNLFYSMVKVRAPWVYFINASSNVIAALFGRMCYD